MSTPKPKPAKPSTTVTAKPTSKQSQTLPKQQKQKTRIVQNYILVWLDSDVDESSSDCQNTLKNLRSIINSVYIFSSCDQCVQFINDIKYEKIFMIISGSLSQLVVPDIHGKSQLDVIYIFCNNKARYENLTKEWSKIKGIHTDIMLICKDLQKAIKQFNHDSMPISFVSHTNVASQNVDQLEPSFMYTKIFKEIIFEIEFDKQSIKDLVDYCSIQYKDNRTELQIIEEFAQNYHAESSVWWYTRECFTYQLLNRGLRTLECDIIMKMAFFIRDLHCQIEALHTQQFNQCQQQTFTVYRGQCLGIADFERLKNAHRGLLSFNNFLSTSKLENVAMPFAQMALTNDGTVGILFKITIDPSISSTPFAMIDKISYFDTEQEILFSMHSVFRVSDIRPMDDNTRLYSVLLTLTGESDRELQKLTEQIREETSPHEKGWYRMGELLMKLYEWEKAEQLYLDILQHSSRSKDQANLYYQLARVKNAQEHYEEAIILYQKAIEIDQTSLPLNQLLIANAYYGIGTVYDNKKEYPQAGIYYDKALEIYQKTLPPNHLNLAFLYNNVGMLYYNIADYSKALSLYGKALEIKEKTVPSNHPSLAASYNNIASVYNDTKKYSEALAYYMKALDIEEKTLPSNHLTLATTYNNVGWVFRNMQNYTKALTFFEHALAIKRNSLPPNHRDIQDIEKSIEYIHKKVNK